jgi:hypothetical protein
MPSRTRKYRGIRWPDVLDGEPNAKVLPLRSESDFAGLSIGTMNLLVNCSSSTR